MHKSTVRAPKRAFSILLAMLMVFSSVAVAFPAVLAAPNYTPSTVASRYNSGATNNTVNNLDFNIKYSLAQNIKNYVTVWTGALSHSDNSWSISGSGNAPANVRSSIANAYPGNAGTTLNNWFGSWQGDSYSPSSPWAPSQTSVFGTSASAEEPEHKIQSGHNNRNDVIDFTRTASRSVIDAMGDYVNDALNVPTSVVTSVSMTVYLNARSDCNHFDTDNSWGHHRHVVEFYYFRAAPVYSTGSTNTGFPITQLKALNTAIATANARTQSNYTTASWDTMTNAKNAAVTLFNAINDNPALAINGNTSYNATAITNATNTLNNAINALQTTITINGNGGTPSATSANITVGTASTANFPTGSYTASRDAYTFQGWNTNSAATTGTKTGNLSVALKGTVYAIWSPTNYTVSYNANGGAAVNATTYNITSTTTLPSTTRTAYTFANWTPTSNVGTWKTNTNYNAGTSLKDKWGNVTLTANWTPVGYTITYDANEGSVSPSTASYNIEDGTTKLATPTRTGYSFAGWKPKVDAGNWVATTTYGAGASVKGYHGNVTLVAQWTINQYTLTVNPNGGTYNNSTGNTDHTQEYNSVRTITDPTRTGYTFGSWTLTGKGAFNASTKVYTYADGAGALTANWTANKYTVAFDGNGATGGSTASIEKTYDTNATLTANGFTKIGYDFNGWSKEKGAQTADFADKGTMSTDLASENGATVTLYAVWKAIQYNVEIDLNSTDPLANYSGETTGIYEQTLTLADPTRPGYVFDGWELVSGNGALNGSDYTFGPGDAKVKATWTPIEYTLTLVLEGGEYTDGSPTTITGIIYDTKTIPDPYREGYTFEGWVKNDTGNGKLENGVFTFSDSNAEYKATWKAIDYTLTVDVNGGDAYTGAINNPYHITDTETIVDPTRTGYDFKDWTITSAKAGTFEDKVYTFSSADTTFTANWTPHTYTIAYDANTGVGDMVATDATYDAYATLTPNAFTKFGYTFVGWARDAASESAEFLDGADDVLNLTADDGAVVTLYAVWSANPHKITLDLGDEDATYEGSPMPVEIPGIVYDTVTLSAPEREGYFFVNWEISSGEGTLTNNVFTFTDDDVVIKANYLPFTYYLSVDLNGDAAHLDDIEYKGATKELYGTTITYPSTVEGNMKTEVTFLEPTRKGYEFVRWDLVSGKGSVSGDKFVFGSSNSTVQAQWEAIPYTLTVDLNSGGYDEDVTYAGDTSITKIIYDSVDLGAPTRRGYTFKGWTVETDGTGTVTDENVFTFTNADATVKAVWEPITYTLTVETGIGFYSGITPVSGIIHETTELEIPERAGYTFEGWQTIDPETREVITGVGDVDNDANTFTFTDSDATIDAIWEAIPYTLTIDLNDGGHPADVTYNEETSRVGIIFDVIDLGAPTRTGYTFKGWTVDAGTVVGNAYTYTNSDATATANWEAIPYSLALNLNAVGFENDVTYEKDTTVDGIIYDEVDLGEPIRKGYTFTGWTLDEENTGAIDGNTFVFTASNAGATANWSANDYTLTVNPNGGEYDGETSFTRNIYDVVTLGRPTLTGYTFIGWVPTAGDVEEDDDTLELTYIFTDSDAEVKAVWRINEYNVTFINGVTGETSSQLVDYNTAAIPPETPELVNKDATTHYRFQKWSQDFSHVVDEMTIHAVYEVEDHDWKVVDHLDAVCEADGYTSYVCDCGATKTIIHEAIGHDWSDVWTDNGDLQTHTRVCLNDNSHTQTEEHTWDAGVITVAPTCYTTGIRVYTCTVCGGQAAEVVPALGHDWSEWEDVDGNAATCTTGGSEHRYCKRCDAEETRTVSARGHNPDILGIEGYCTYCGEFRCKNCLAYEGMKDVPVIGILYRLVHYFIHTFRQIKYMS